MTVGSSELDEMIKNFDKHFFHIRLDKEKQENWKNGQIYQNGETNNLFKAFQLGYSFARVNYIN